jgi:hypothetical protein
MRKLAVLFSSTMDRDFRTYRMDRFAEIDAEAIKRLLTVVAMERATQSVLGQILSANI